MARISKCIVAIITAVILAISVFTLVGNAFAQTIPKPFVPEFTLKVVDKSHDVAPTTFSTTNPYNNRTDTRSIPGYHVTDYQIELTIKNQPYSTTINGNLSTLYYFIQKKGYFENWTETYSDVDFPEILYPQSDSEYTRLLFSAISYPSDAIVDFRAKAILGYTHKSFLPDHIMPIPVIDFLYEASDWSNTQTISLSDESVSPSPSVPEFPIQLILLLFAVIPLIVVIILRKRSCHE